MGRRERGRREGRLRTEGDGGHEVRLGALDRRGDGGVEEGEVAAVGDGKPQVLAEVA